MGKRTVLCLCLGIVLSACGGEGEFSPTGNMNAPRHGHTATKTRIRRDTHRRGPHENLSARRFRDIRPAPGNLQTLQDWGPEEARLAQGAPSERRCPDYRGLDERGGEALRDSFLIQARRGNSRTRHDEVGPLRSHDDQTAHRRRTHRRRQRRQTRHPSTGNLRRLTKSASSPQGDPCSWRASSTAPLRYPEATSLFSAARKEKGRATRNFTSPQGEEHGWFEA